MPYRRVLTTTVSDRVAAIDESGQTLTRNCVNYTSQDYLDLAQDARTNFAAKEAVDRYGVRCPGSPALLGCYQPMLALREAMTDHGITIGGKPSPIVPAFVRRRRSGTDYLRLSSGSGTAGQPRGIPGRSRQIVVFFFYEVYKMRRFSLFLVMLLALTLALTACGGGDTGRSDPASSDSGGNAVRGEELYKQTAIGSASAPGCITCHSLEAGVALVGPSHMGIATKAETAVAGMSAEEYLRQSIMEPDAVISEGFAAGVMYQNYANDLTEQEIDDLVAFLKTLK